MLRVGVDCRPLARPLSGIGRYTSELLSRLTRLEGVQWFLYADRPFQHECLERANVQVAYGRARGSLAELLWFHLRLPALIRRDGLDVFWSPRHHFPARLPRDLTAVLTVHDLTWKRFPSTMKPLQYWSERLQMPYSLRRAQRVISVSVASGEDIRHFFPACADKVRVIPCGVSKLAEETPVASLPDQYLLFVGTLEPRKNLFRLLEAYALLPARLRASYPLVLVGGTGWKLSVEQLIEQHGLAGQVQVLGSLDDGGLATVYSKAKLLLMPSLYEGFGLPILEAFQFGVPVLTSTVSAMPEVAGQGGVLVDPQSSASISEGMRRLLTDEVLYAQCVRGAAQQLPLFSWDLACAATAQVLQGD